MKFKGTASNEASPPQISSARMERLILFACAFLILIHLIASFFPHLRLWGINQLHYFPLEFRIAVCAIGLLVLVPKVNEFLSELFTRVFTLLAERFKKKNKYLKYSLISLLSLIVFWFLRAKTPLLGDGYLRAGEVNLGRLISITEPLDFYLHLLVSKLFNLDGYTTYGVLSCIAGAIYIFLILLLCDLWGKDNKERLFIFLILATMGATQLFFGYIESYSFMYISMMAYIFFGMRYLKGKSGFLWPCLFLLLAASFHLSALFVLPSLFYLAFAKPLQPSRQKIRRIHRTGKIKFTNVVSLVCVISLIFLGLYLMKTYFPQESSGSFLIFPFGSGESFYSFFSMAHLMDFVNHQLLISPVSIVLCLVLLILRGSINFKENVVKFLLGIMVCLFGFALFVDPKLGYARDWDLFASTGLGVTFLGLYLVVDILRGEKTMELGRVIVVLLVAALISTMPWILVNASEEKAIERFEELLKIDEKRAAHGYENLACYFRDKGEHEKTIKLWKKAIAINPNPRYYGTLGNAYLKLKRYDQAMEALNQAIQMAPYHPLIHLTYKNLGICLAEVGRYDEAVTQLKKTISLEPNNAVYYYILGNILGKSGRYEEAVPCFETAIRLDSTNANAYKMLGVTYGRMGKKEEAKRYLEAYLRSTPKDAPMIKGIIDSIEIQIEYGR
ncbi:MAG: hypothetical protein AMJ91_00165 [candidate division Zixibacteria bacterium SM23_73_3]|nr:MAG: hypothetical protein AMJ91_00165 [candidate division Zixibacteria bacterium SM23_73_3]